MTMTIRVAARPALGEGEEDESMNTKRTPSATDLRMGRPGKTAWLRRTGRLDPKCPRCGQPMPASAPLCDDCEQED